MKSDSMSVTLKSVCQWLYNTIQKLYLNTENHQYLQDKNIQ